MLKLLGRSQWVSFEYQSMIKLLRQKKDQNQGVEEIQD